MEFHEAANFLFDLRRFGRRPGIEATANLLSYLDDPQEDVDCVQIAGSNGKGSTACMLAAILREAGLSVGVYTSPHLEDVRERITIDGRPMTERSLHSFVETVAPFVRERATDGEAPTFFETLTAMALWEFGRQDVDVAVLEVGIGGRHDPTSVVEPIASGLTTVVLEHTDVLGESVEEITRDKATVAPSNAPLVTGTTGSALATVRDAVEGVRTVGRADTDADADTNPDLTVTWEGRDALESRVTIATADGEVSCRLGLLGPHQARNAGVAAALARQVGEVTDDTLAAGLRRAHLPGRFEVMGREPLIVLDGAHNPGGCRAVAETLEAFEFADLHVVIGAMVEKDHRGIARALDAADRVTACRPPRDRAADKAVIAQAFAAETDAEVDQRADVAGALADALDGADPGDCVLVVGSLYAAAEARTRWARSMVPKRVDSIPAAKETLREAHVTAAGTWRMRGKAVHRVVKTRVQARQAQYLKEELLSLGGECAVSGLNDQDGENLDVVLMGTLAQFKRLVRKLQGQPFGLAPLAKEVERTLGFETPDTTDTSRTYPWTDGTAVMGILNVTPDSFHDGAEYNTTDDAIERAREMVAAGADVVDVGGESTRPGADPVSVEEERSRVVPVIEATADLDALISVDTRKPAVARAALSAGADVLNDVTGLEKPAMRRLAAEYDVPVVLMHSLDAPVDPDRSVTYDDVVEDVIDALQERILRAERAGIDRSQIVIDPGLGFGKTAAENFELLSRLEEFRALGCPIMVGHSHKSMFELVDCGPEARYEPTVAATALAVDRGADLVRVHDVTGNRAAVDVVETAGAAGPGKH